MTKKIEYQEKSEDDDDLTTNTKPSYLTHPITFIVLFSTIIFLDSATLYGYIGGVLTTIERRFQISSTTSGTLSTLNSISSLSVLIFVCYFGAKLHIPRVLGVSGITVGIGLLLNALPHVIFVPYQPTSDSGYGFYASGMNNTLMCSPENTEHSCTEQETNEVKYGQLIDIWPIALGQVILGIGNAALYPLGITYLDDSTKDRSTTGLYVAIILFLASAGPFAGFSVTAKVLGYRTDFYKHDDTSIQADGSGSIGAWWLGFVIFGTLTIVFSIPLLFFPRKLAVWESSCMSRIRRKPTDDDFDVAAAYRSLQPSEEKQGLIILIKEFLVALKRMVTNPITMSLNLGIAASASIGVGLTYFFAKYLETQFDLHPTKAAFFTGVVFLPGTLIGVILGGAITSVFRLRTAGMCRLIIVLAFIGLIVSSAGILVKCPQRKIAGLTTGYNSITHRENNSTVVASGPCNENCSCPSNVYQPICGSDGLTTYLSPCHAGCIMAVAESNITNDRNVSAFDDCSCFSSADMTSEKMPINEACPRNCSHGLMIYMVVTIVWSLLSSILYNPMFLLIMRTVDKNDRPLALGCFGLIMRVLGMIPAPIYFGAVIQSTCLLRSSVCGQEGACLVYDTDAYRLRYIGLQIGLDVISLSFFIITMFLINRKISATHSPLDTRNPDDMDDVTTGI
ncbi:solute carrier organic anion transporter family member 2A1-like [Anneissia japonica]|uniref:solute carrier organic anion transporter family member 2A1-like n=1 Tax=Anneissia japonica TaxID=1529436 RepID=UPI0014256972|nr:solute carrier organic anion transporter family member 2A1-like [Anneissia japonica]